jgi:WD40 repeat protein
VVGIAFQPTGTLVATVSNHDVWLWDRKTGHVTRKLQGPPLRDVQWSPDGRWIVAAGPTTAALWEVATDTVPALLRAPVERPFSAVAFGGDDGRLIIAASLDGSLRTYHCLWCGDARDLLLLAKQRIEARS